MASSTNSLKREMNATGQVFDYYHKQAWQHFRDQELEQALTLARRMLSEPSMGDFHRAGFHLLMAFSDDQYVDHAERSLALFNSLHQNPHVEKLKTHAQTILRDARVDRAQEQHELASTLPADPAPSADDDFEDGSSETEETQEADSFIEVDLIQMVAKAQDMVEAQENELFGSLAGHESTDEEDDFEEDEEESDAEYVSYPTNGGSWIVDLDAVTDGDSDEEDVQSEGLSEFMELDDGESVSTELPEDEPLTQMPPLMQESSTDEEPRSSKKKVQGPTPVPTSDAEPSSDV